ncbi:5'-methylthioadenosine/adenosylhomocysteine nucleosidase [Nitrosophilus kaiyonis]|uniref:5'-methylthioadenosine/adenosylhomocysteine nucleosidase n=1 Tax=Nitrosophilus kaiyonis TaxID=2930200 RepID=UPI0024926D89|nr:5'-methylthioadenosine/adenosylhomocysteine nucleosidase [Nitrosophilus kaiyonis]
MKIAIMGAMPEEIEPLLSYMNDIKSYELADNRYYEAKYKGIDVVLAYSKIGKVFASLTASVMIQHFKAQKLLFSGVAGAINENLKIGDLIAATKLCQHDLDITAFGHPYGYVPEGKVYIESDKELLFLAKNIAKTKGIDLKEGIIATGDQFIADPKKKEWIKNTFSADALEMEGAAVAVVCDAFDIPFFILRAISDAADMDAGFDFDKFLEKSSKISADFIISMLDEMV